MAHPGQLARLVAVAIAAWTVAGCPLGLDFDALDRPGDDADTDMAADAAPSDAATDDSDADAIAPGPDVPPQLDAAGDVDSDVATDARDATDGSVDAPVDAPPADADDSGPDAGDDAGSDVDAGPDTSADAAADVDAGPADTCGDAVVDPGEGCDDGEDNADAPDACRTDCQPPRCGDGVIDTGEACDDGNLIPGDGCSDTCARTPGGFCAFCDDDGDCGEETACRDDGAGLRCLAPCERSSRDCPFFGLGQVCEPVDATDDRWCRPTEGCSGWCGDFDRDGYFAGAPDCEPFDCDDERSGVNPSRPEVCDNGRDNDCDGFVDCDDLDCAGELECRATGESCTNGVDDRDPDDLVDCEDPDCAASEACVTGTCFSPLPLPPGRTETAYWCRSGARHPIVAADGCTSLGETGPASVYVFEADTAGVLDVWARDADPAVAVDVRVQVRRGACENPRAMVACDDEVPCGEGDVPIGDCIRGVQPRAARVTVDVEPGPWFVIIDTLERDRGAQTFACGRVSLDVTFRPADGE